MSLLVTGGAGYIGSHVCLELLRAGHDVVAFDNFANSSPVSLKRVEELAGRSLEVVSGDMRNEEAIDAAFEGRPIEAVIHLAGLKAVGESVAEPLLYYSTNLSGTFGLCRVMARRGVKKMVFSSSATVYGLPDNVPVKEDAPLRATNPYGRTKLMSEEVLRDICAADKEWSAVMLRYFNPVGADPSGRIGESPRDAPANLVPYIAQVAVGKRERLRIFGNDYPTPDGTGVRDYIHIVDLAQGHLAALKALQSEGAQAFNLGTGRGYSVLEMLHQFEHVCGHAIPYSIEPRRPGDVASCYADVSKARDELGWSAQRGLEEMCADTWRWQQQNPDGLSEA